MKMKQGTITIEEYLTKKDISFIERNGELITNCLFNDCDDDSRLNEHHLYFDKETGQYHCKKCNVTGNLVTLAKHLDGNIEKILKEVNKNKRTREEKADKKIQELAEQCHKNLTPELLAYLKTERGLSEEIINEFKLGCGEKKLTIPVFDDNDKVLYLKLRKLPGDNTEPRYLNYPKGLNGNESQLYNPKALKNTEEVYIASGELDCLIAVSMSLPSVSSTAGEGALKESWLKQIKDAGIKKVTLIPDTDVPGLKARNDNLKKLIDFGFDEVNVIDLKLKDVKNKDLTDAYVKERMTKEELLSLKKRVIEVEEKRTYEVKKPEQELDYTSWKNVIETHFPEFSFAFEIAISIPIQLLINDVRNPFGLFFIGVPGEGKTIKLNVLDCVPEITYSTDKFTAASFVSNSTARKKDELKNVDMLPRIRHKLLINKDAAPLFGKEPKELTDILGTLTRIFDGEGFQTDTGAHGGRGYKGDYTFMMLGASTPIRQNVWDVMGSLGARLFFYNLTSLPKDKNQLIKQLKSGSYKQKEKVCRETTGMFLRTLFNKYPDGIDWDTNSDREECLGVIADCALLLSRLRGVIKSVKDSESNSFEFTDPLIEDPSRINQLLYNLCRAYAVACGRTHIEKHDLKVVLAVALDSAPDRRSKIIKMLIESGGKLKTSTVMDLIGKSQDTALREMKKLEKLGVVSFSDLSPSDQTQAQITLNSSFKWFLEKEYQEILGLIFFTQPIPEEKKQDFCEMKNEQRGGFLRTRDTGSQKTGDDEVGTKEKINEWNKKHND